MLFFLFVYATSIPIGAQQKDDSDTDDEPALELTASPRNQIWRMAGGGPQANQVRLMVIIKNADKAYWCPALAIFWGDEEHTERSSTCDPYEVILEESPEELRYSSDTYYHRYRSPGTFTITVVLFRYEDGEWDDFDHESVDVHLAFQ